MLRQSIWILSKKGWRRFSIARVVLASHAGFCFGVRRAVETAERNAPAMTLGPIIHNPQVVTSLEAIGVRSAGGVDEIPAGSKVVIRSHGIGRDAYQALVKKECR